MATSRRILDVYSVNYYPPTPACSSNICMNPPPVPFSLTSVSPLPSPPPLPSLPQKTPSDDTTIGIDQTHKYSIFHHHAILALTLLACIFFISLLSTAVLVFFYRRLRQRRALEALVATPFFPSDPGPDPGPDPGDDPIHHVWYIRTVGLDEATIESIAVTQYRAGSGLLGSADCSVCLGNFEDGDLVRLLPKCGHAFHVPCIDTWLRAHVNCPLCRSDVVDPKVATADVDSTSATSEASAGDTEETGSQAQESVELRLVEDLRDREENEHEGEVFVDIPLSDSSSDPGELPESMVQAGSEEREPTADRIRHRSASVDSPFMVPRVVIMIPETNIDDQVLKESTYGEEQSGKEKERPGNELKAASNQTGDVEMLRSLSSNSASARAFFFTRKTRSRSSILPL